MSVMHTGSQGRCLPRPVAIPAGSETENPRISFSDPQAAQPAFATRAQARLLDALGWQLSNSPRRDMDCHAPLQCCFVLRDGRREEAAFGYTAVTAPLDTECGTLRRAKAHVERFLGRIGEDSGMLIQNMPLFAFGGRRQDRIALFGGWRLRCGEWRPFLLGPDGLAGVARQDVLFAPETAPSHMAEICGHATQTVAPHLAALVRSVEALGRRPTGPAVASGPSISGVQIVQGFDGWATARSARLPEAGPIRRTIDILPSSGRVRAAGEALWATEADEFRFHEFGADRG